MPIATLPNHPPAPAGIGSGTTPEDNMQRRLTDGEAERIARAYDALLGFSPGLDNSTTQSCRMLLQDMLTHNTTDGLPYVEPPLTDEDARARPWVMIRAGENFPWTGPATLVDCLQANKARFLVVWPDKKSWSSCMFARRATPDEIAAAEATAPDA